MNCHEGTAAALSLQQLDRVLHLSGYVANVEQTAQALFGIRLFFGPVLLLVLLLAIPLLIWYPITRESHAEVLK